METICSIIHLLDGTLRIAFSRETVRHLSASWRGGHGGASGMHHPLGHLNDAEIVELDRWIRRHTTERFGPVRAVEPLQVFELAFEGLQPSSRHKSGIAVRFPRIARWRQDKPAAEADTLATALALVEGVP